MKTNLPITLVLSFSLLFSCQSKGDESKDTPKKDTVVTDDLELPEIEEVEMESVYEVKYINSGKTITMSQEEYLESMIWDDPNVVIKEIPVVK